MSAAETSSSAEPTDTLEEVRSFRQRVIANGYRPVTVRSCSKAPLTPNWQRGEDPASLLDVRPKAANTGLLLAGLRCIDLDIDDEQLVREVDRLAHQHLPGGALVRRRANSPRLALLYRAAEGEPSKRVAKGPKGMVEVLGLGQQAVVHGLHPTGAAVTWQNGRGPDTVPHDQVPAVSEQQITEFLNACAPLLGASISEPETGASLFRVGVSLPGRALPPELAKLSDRVNGVPVENELGAGIEPSNWYGALLPEEKSAVVAACLNALDNRTADPRGRWLRVMFAVAHAEQLGCPDARQLALEWSRCGKSWTTEADFEKTWTSYKPIPGGITVGSLLAMATDAGLDVSLWRDAALTRLHGVPDAVGLPPVYYYPGNEAACRDALDEVVAADPHTFTMGDKLVILREPDQKAPEFKNWNSDLPGTTPALPADIIERAEELKWMGPAGGKGRATQ